MVLEVYRGDGRREGTPLVEPLLADDALIHRGIAEMEAHAHPFHQMEMAVVFRPGLRLGQLIEAADPSTAHPYRAKVTGIEITVAAGVIDLNLTLEQPP